MERTGAAAKTVEKALGLLTYFTTEDREIGLADLARRCELDKATTLRLLNALRLHGFVEQNPDNKRYRLGSAFLRFARVREASYPAMSVMQPILERLSERTGETAHGTLASGSHLITIGVAEPVRSARVYIDPAQPLPFHATASGVAYLAFAPDDIRSAVLKKETLDRFTDQTATSTSELSASLEAARTKGYSVSARTFEPDVVGVAMPIFGWSGTSVGAVAVACIASRWGDELEARIVPELRESALDITGGMGGDVRLLSSVLRPR